jgi:hypothetical protein
MKYGWNLGVNVKMDIEILKDKEQRARNLSTMLNGTSNIIEDA